MPADLLISSSDIAIGLRVRKNTWRELPSLFQGGQVRMQDNSVVSTKDFATRKRIFECEVYVTSSVEAAALTIIAGAGTTCMITGAVVEEGPFSVLCDVGVRTSLRTRRVPLTIHQTAALHFEEA